MDHLGLFMVADSSGDPLKGDLAFQEHIAKLMTASTELLETVKDCSVMLSACGLKDTFEAKRCRAVIATLEQVK